MADDQVAVGGPLATSDVLLGDAGLAPLPSVRPGLLSVRLRGNFDELNKFISINCTVRSRLTFSEHSGLDIGLVEKHLCTGVLEYWCTVQLTWWRSGTASRRSTVPQLLCSRHTDNIPPTLPHYNTPQLLQNSPTDPCLAGGFLIQALNIKHS